MLFPTKFQTEGIPGTILDAYTAGLPVICSNWIRRRCIVNDQVTGLTYPFGSFDGLIQTMEYAMSHQEKIRWMRDEYLKYYVPYQADVAILPLIEELT